MKVKIRRLQPSCSHFSCLCNELRNHLIFAHNVIENQPILNINIEKDTIFKETTDFSKAMRGKFFDIIVVLILWIIGTNCNYLVIVLSLDKKKKEAILLVESLKIWSSYNMSYIPDQSWASIQWPWLEGNIQEVLAPTQITCLINH